MRLCRSSAGFSESSSVCLQKRLATPYGAFHAYYQDDVGVFGIEPVELIGGSLPKRQKRLAEAWAELHQAELFADWQTLQEGRKPAPIEPLK